MTHLFSFDAADESKGYLKYLQSLGDLGNSGWYLSKPSEATVNRAALADAPLRAHLGRAAGTPLALARKKPRTHRDTNQIKFHRHREQRHLSSCVFRFIWAISNQEDNPLCAV